MNSDVKQLAFSLIYIDEMLEKIKVQNSIQANEAKLDLIKNAKFVLATVKEESDEFLRDVQEEIDTKISSLQHIIKEEISSELEHGKNGARY